jgi:hypothetical protein
MTNTHHANSTLHTHPAADGRGLRLRSLAAVIAGCALLQADGALAGSATIASTGGDSMVFEYADGDKLRINTPQDDTYMVVRDNTLYAVSFNNGQPMVMNASKMMKGFANMAQMTEQATPAAATGELVSIKATGRKETVAGVTGEVYEVRTREDGDEMTREVVMSSDPRALELRDAMFTMARAGSAIIDEEARRNSEDFQARLEDMDMGILRYGSEMTVTSIDGDTVAAARFELPAEPMDMSDLGGLMGAMQGAAGQQGAAGSSSAPAAQEESGGGLFSGMMNRITGKAEEKKEQTENRVENEVDGKTDEAIDGAIDKAFKKLFGN